jgi:hypothetical protein
MFKVGNVYGYLGLQNLVFIQEIIQSTIIVGSFTINPINLIANDCSEGEDDEFDSLKDYMSNVFYA